MHSIGNWHAAVYRPFITFLERLVIDPAEAAVTIDGAENVEFIKTTSM